MDARGFLEALGLDEEPMGMVYTDKEPDEKRHHGAQARKLTAMCVASPGIMLPVNCRASKTHAPPTNVYTS